jgi:hypothetical protein
MLSRGFSGSDQCMITTHENRRCFNCLVPWTAASHSSCPLVCQSDSAYKSLAKVEVDDLAQELTVQEESVPQRRGTGQMILSTQEGEP